MGDTAPSSNGTSACIAHTVPAQPNPATHRATHLPTQVRQQRINSKASLRDWVLLDRETVALGSCYVSSGSSAKVPKVPKVSVATAPVSDGDRLPQSIHLAATAEAFPTDSCPDASGRFCSSILLPLLAGWMAGWLTWPAGWH